MRYPRNSACPQWQNPVGIFEIFQDMTIKTNVATAIKGQIHHSRLKEFFISKTCLQIKIKT